MDQILTSPPRSAVFVLGAPGARAPRCAPVRRGGHVVVWHGPGSDNCCAHVLQAAVVHIH
eukprot:6077113-Pyramimonas_sp.AAC.1